MGEIYLSNDPHGVIEELDLPKEDIRIFECEEFKLDLAKNVITEAYISSSKAKFLILIGKSFNKEAQNALLKVLEEPPKNIHFLLFAPNRNAFIPTIRSRMRVINKTNHIPIKPLDLDLKNLDHAKIYDFLHSLDYLSKTQAQEVIERLLMNVKDSKILLSSQELNLFDLALRANYNHQRLATILVPLLILFLEKRK